MYNPLTQRFIDQWGFTPRQRPNQPQPQFQPPPMVLPAFQQPDLSYLQSVMGQGPAPMNAGLRFTPSQPGAGVPGLPAATTPGRPAGGK